MRESGKKEQWDETQFTAKIFIVLPVISFCKIFIPSYAFDAPYYYAETGHPHPPNHMTLWILVGAHGRRPL